jgi:hypothetical protein
MPDEVRSPLRSSAIQRTGNRLRNTTLKQARIVYGGRVADAGKGALRISPTDPASNNCYQIHGPHGHGSRPGWELL